MVSITIKSKAMTQIYIPLIILIIIGIALVIFLIRLACKTADMEYDRFIGRKEDDHED
jgi:hypothetical protein